MRHTILATSICLLLGGCATQNAFEAFHLDSDAERAVTNLRTVTLSASGRTEAILSAVYLNAVDPQRYRSSEQFLIAWYDRNGSIPDDLTLNGVAPESFRELKHSDPLLQYLPTQNEWSRYYRLTYPLQKQELLLLAPGSDRNATGVISYQKDGR